MTVYLDNAATTALDPEVLDAMMPYMTERYGNPSSTHQYGRETRTAIEHSRRTIAEILNASTGEIFFTSGGTESNNMILRGVVRDLGVKRIVTSAIEHHCVLNTVKFLEATQGVEILNINTDNHGQINLNHLAEVLSTTKDIPTLVSLMHANNEVGTVLDLDAVGQLCKEYGALCHSDTVQTLGSKKIDLHKTNVQFMAGSAHKFHGPKGVGFVYINSENSINPLIYGGSQERNMRAGTENLYGIVGLGKAMEIAYRDFDQINANIGELRLYMENRLSELFGDILVFGDPQGQRLDKVLNVGFPPSKKSSLLQFNLDIHGIAVSSGSACSSGSDKASHVLSHLHPGSNLVPVRFSFSKFNTRQEVDYVLEKLSEILAESLRPSQSA